MIVDSYKDMESTVYVEDSTLDFVVCIPIRVATDSVSYVSSARNTAFPNLTHGNLPAAQRPITLVTTPTRARK